MCDMIFYVNNPNNRLIERGYIIVREAKSVYFISHTHWDREWFLTQEQYRIRLIRLIDHMIAVLEHDPEFECFHLDGQTIVLDDYLAVRKQNESRLRKLVREGRVIIGPWYEQNDLYLTSAESTVRNLMEGIRTSREWGREMKVGYLPDQFGIIGQMPQIFRGVGIENCIFGRGFSYSKHSFPHFMWSAPDGTALFTVLLTHWYNNAQRLPEDSEQLEQMFAFILRQEESSNPTPHLLMMNGVDHLEAQENLPLVIRKLKERYGSEYRFVHANLAQYVEILQHSYQSQPLGQVTGELRDKEKIHMLLGTLSSRVYLKQANADCHNVMEKWLEPLSAWCALTGLEENDREYMRFLWKLWMENHPHDSICGCSQDAVHEHMMDRHKRVMEIAEGLLEQKLQLLAAQISEEGFQAGNLKLLAVNTSQLGNAATIRTPIYFMSEDQVADFTIEDECGNRVPYRLIGAEECRTMALSPINLPGVLQVKRFDVEWQPTPPAFGYSCYRITAHQKGKRIEDGLGRERLLENNHLCVEVLDHGQYTILHKKSGKRFEYAGQIHEVGDRGSLYDCQPLDDARVWNEQVEFVYHLSNELYQELQYRFVWALPAALDESLAQRVPQKIGCPFTVTLRLDRDSPYLRATVEVDNRVKDHRIRLLFPVPEAEKVWAGGQYDVVDRACNEADAPNLPCNLQPFWKWVAGKSEHGGLAVYANGLHEYEMMDEHQALGITLLRGAATIHDRERTPMEPDQQPLGQCLGAYRFELAIRPFADESKTTLYQEAEQFQQGIRTKQLAVDDARWIQGRAYVQDSPLSGAFERPDPNQQLDKWPRSAKLLALDGQSLVSVVKWAEHRDYPLLRLYNVEHELSQIRLEWCRPLHKLVRTNLLEEEEESREGNGTSWQHAIAAKKIETWMVKDQRNGCEF